MTTKTATAYFEVHEYDATRDTWGCQFGSYDREDAKAELDDMARNTPRRNLRIVRTNA